MSGDKGSKTEEATPQKLRKAREKGQVARSEEFVPLFMVLFAILYFWLGWDSLIDHLKHFFETVPVFQKGMDFQTALGNALSLWFNELVLRVMLPFSLMMFFAGVVGNVVQFGFIWSLDPIQLKFDKIHPVSGFKRIFAMKQVVKTLFSAIKVIVIGTIIFFVVKTSIREYMHDISVCDVDCILNVMFSLMRRMLSVLIPVLVVLVAFDLIYQKMNFKKEQRMTKDEVKREFKNREGDPLIKGQRKSEQRRLLAEDIGEMMKSTRVVIAGLGKAAMLMYTDDMPLPALLAIGRAKLSLEIIRAAKKEGVPVVADPALLRLLEDEGVIDQFIPSSAIKRVAKAIQRGDQGGL